MKSKIILLGIGLIGLAILGLYQLLSFSDDKLHVVFCDVGQGDAIFIRTPDDVDILIDGGPDDSVLKCLSDNMPFWDREIDLVFATHPDADHITGLVEVVRRYEVGGYYTSMMDKDTGVVKELKKGLRDKGLEVKEIREGDRFLIGGDEGEIILETFWPQEEFVREKLTDDTNAYSLVQKLTYGKTSVLLTGDITFDILNPLMDQIGPTTIFKAPHHGSYTGINEDTFLYSKPQFVIISDGKDNRYGHPHASVLKELKDRNIPYLRTDQVGEIEFVSDGEKVWVVE